ncbi:RNA polymerase sigma factor [Aureliella helgolandensis]|uniref:ECF RNA polymerase sigma factor SigE n=1 Tax=Aureliella helgolandensis TaxID=2527968 RepID=A0A518GG52_9BACT|nr:sigma-70 family RNA polymerase sigma factor [Aureliella helgolandensis]QDV27528.1 ECF RNA polymerase sigma factor SigE [Aureliella helgolandensis]
MTHPDHPTLSSHLLDEVQRMDAVAWGRLVSTYGPIVYRWCRTSGVPEGEASDVVQEVFAAVARGVSGFQREKKEGSFRSWLATITRNKVRDYFRRQAKGLVAVGGTTAMLKLEQCPEDLGSTIDPAAAESPVVQSVLRQVQAEFEPQTWKAFWQSAIDGKSAAEVAEGLGVSVASVYQAKSRVLRRLRKSLAELPQ